MGSKSNSQLRADDRISELPDAVLCHILSFLSTKHAVRTSVLSARWKNLWTSVPNLDFDNRGFFSTPGFSEFVDHVLFFRDSAPIKKFRLFHSHAEDFSHVAGWIRTAVRCSAAELDLFVDSESSDDYEGLELPEGLFTCRTLMVLKLMSNFIVNIPTSGCFPCLKVLYVTFDYPPNHSVEKLFMQCPVLEDLTIDGALDGDVFSFNICAPELKRLSITLLTSYDLLHPHNLCINAPKLESIDIKEGLLSNYTVEHTKSLVGAKIYLCWHDVDDECVKRTTTLLAGISSVKVLCISSHISQVCSLPTFDNLSKLTLVLHICCYRWGMLVELLKRSPALQCLVLENDSRVYESSWLEEDPYDHVESSGFSWSPPRCAECLAVELEDPDDVHSSDFKLQWWITDPNLSNWNPPDFVPICLSSHIETITMRAFRGEAGEIEVAKYLLKNGEVLNKMTICTAADLWIEKKELFEKFSMFERGSKTCELEFIEMKSSRFYEGEKRMKPVLVLYHPSANLDETPGTASTSSPK